MPTEIELLPCPFCGGDGSFCETSVWWVRCNNCDSESGGGYTKAEAVAAWNRRAPPASIARDEVLAVDGAMVGRMMDSLFGEYTTPGNDQTWVDPDWATTKARVRTALEAALKSPAAAEPVTAAAPVANGMEGAGEPVGFALPSKWPHGTRVKVPDPTRVGEIIGRVNEYSGDYVHVSFPIGSWFGPASELVLWDDHRDVLGRIVRHAWVRWARRQPSPKQSWLVPYDELSENDKEADRQIGESLALYVIPPLTLPAGEAQPVAWRWNRDMTKLPAAITLLFLEPMDKDGMETVRLGLAADAGSAIAWSHLPEQGRASPEPGEDEVERLYKLRDDVAKIRDGWAYNRTVMGFHGDDKLAALTRQHIEQLAPITAEINAIAHAASTARSGS